MSYFSSRSIVSNAPWVHKLCAQLKTFDRRDRLSALEPRSLQAMSYRADMETESRRAWPFRDLVPDEATALAIGTVFIRAYFGDAEFDRWGPYTARRMSDEWAFLGTNAELEAQVREFERLNPGSVMSVRGGGMPGVSFSAHDARVMSIAHQR